jgi:hypothetical protein
MYIMSVTHITIHVEQCSRYHAHEPPINSTMTCPINSTIPIKTYHAMAIKQYHHAKNSARATARGHLLVLI